MPGYPGASRAFAIRKLLIAAACDTRIRVSQAGLPDAAARQAEAPIRGLRNAARRQLVGVPTNGLAGGHGEGAAALAG
jgi:hypothetical protein